MIFKSGGKSAHGAKGCVEFDSHLTFPINNN